MCVVEVVKVWRGEERGRERKREGRQQQAMSSFFQCVGLCGVVGEWVDESNLS